jgi:hypothetical protein
MDPLSPVPAAAVEVFAGIDWGCSPYRLCLLGSDGNVLLQQRFAHTVDGLTGLCVAVVSADRHVRIAIERSEGLPAGRLLTLEVPVYCISPKISARSRERYQMAARKSDSPGAFVLADSLRREHAHWRPILSASPLLTRLRAVICGRERLYLVTRSPGPAGKGRVRWVNRWKAALNAFAITFEGRLSLSEDN